MDGFIADTAFSIDLENSQENKKIIEASEKALENALKKIKKDSVISEIGAQIEKTITSNGLNPIINLSGHEMKPYDLHSGLTIPNFDNKKSDKIQNGLYAIEPFSTNGNGKVYDGKPSGIYNLINNKNPRSQFAR